MLRGAKKNMIVVRTRDSRMFEEAYFVMRRERGTATADDPDILWEANRILESATLRNGRSPREAEINPRRLLRRNLLWFGLGLFSGGGIVGLCLLLF